jgi:hypothetical protein
MLGRTKNDRRIEMIKVLKNIPALFLRTVLCKALIVITIRIFFANICGLEMAVRIYSQATLAAFKISQ